MRPAVYTIVEDIMAVDAEEGLKFRIAFDNRYTESPIFRNLLFNLSWLWGLSVSICAAALTAVIFTISNIDVAYVIGASTTGSEDGRSE